MPQFAQAFRPVNEKRFSGSSENSQQKGGLGSPPQLLYCTVMCYFVCAAAAAATDAVLQNEQQQDGHLYCRVKVGTDQDIEQQVSCGSLQNDAQQHCMQLSAYCGNACSVFAQQRRWLHVQQMPSNRAMLHSVHNFLVTSCTNAHFLSLGCTGCATAM